MSFSFETLDLCKEVFRLFRIHLNGRIASSLVQYEVTYFLKFLWNKWVYMYMIWSGGIFGMFVLDMCEFNYFFVNLHPPAQISPAGLWRLPLSLGLISLDVPQSSLLALLISNTGLRSLGWSQGAGTAQFQGAALLHSPVYSPKLMSIFISQAEMLLLGEQMRHSGGDSFVPLASN